MRYQKLINNFNFKEKEIKALHNKFSFQKKLIFDKKFLSPKFKNNKSILAVATRALDKYFKIKKWTKFAHKEFYTIFGAWFSEVVLLDAECKNIVSKHIDYSDTKQMIDFSNTFFKETGLFDEIFQLLCCLHNAIKQENIGRLFYSHKDINKIYFFNSPDFVIEFSNSGIKSLLYLEVCGIPLNKINEIQWSQVNDVIQKHLHSAFAGKNGIKTKHDDKNISNWLFYIFSYKQLRNVSKPYIQFLTNDESKQYQKHFLDTLNKFFKKYKNINFKDYKDYLLIENKWKFCYNVT